MEYRVLLFPLVGALIGWFTNYIAVKMLFRPYRPVKVLGFRFQGLIPKRRREIARSIAKTIERDILSARDLAAILEEMDWEEEIERTVEDVIEHRFKGNQFKRLPVVGLLSENLLYHVKYILTKEIMEYLSTKKGDLVSKFQNRIDLKNIVVNRIDSLDLRGFERLLQELIHRELRHIEWIGGIIGFIIGSFQVGLYYLLK